MLRRIVQSFAQATNGGIQVVVEIDKNVVTPQAMLQVLAGYQFSGMF
jgi:hypothetical protein